MQCRRKTHVTLVPMISSTLLWMSASSSRLMCPLRTFLSQIWRGLLPIEYKIDKKPDWNVFLNMVVRNRAVRTTGQKLQVRKELL